MSVAANPFEHDELSDRDILRELHSDFRDFRGETRSKWAEQDKDISSLDTKVSYTNGRLKEMELFRAKLEGGVKGIGLIVIPVATAVIVWALTGS